MREFTQRFVKYDADFEYGAELPEIFLKYVVQRQVLSYSYI